MSKLAISEKSMPVFNYIKENESKNLTAADIASALGLEKKSVDGIVTSGLQRKGYTERIPAEIENADGTHTPIKVIKLTDAGRAYNHEAAIKADAEAAVKAATEA